MPQHDGGLIRGMESLIVEAEVGWRQLYDELGVVPYEVVYEDLVSAAGYARSVLGVLDHLGVDTAHVTVPPPRTHRQADERTEEWVARYLAERD